MSDTAPREVAAPAPDRLVLLTNDAMRARRRPLAIVVVWAYELLLASAIIWPVSGYLGGAYGGHPRGDAPLFRAGGLALADLLVRARPVVPALTSHASLLLGVGTVLGLVPLACLIVSVAYVTPARKPPPLRAALARALSSFPRMLALFLLMSVVEAVFMGLALVLGGATAGVSAAGIGEARSQQLGAVVFLIFLIGAMLAGIVHDMARTASIRFDVGAIRALRLAVNALRRGVVAAVWSWGWRAMIGWLPVATAALVAARLGGRAGFALWALALLHQLVILTRVALRASWLAKALRLVDHAHRVVRAPEASET